MYPCSRFYSSTDFDAPSTPQLSAHSVLLPCCSSVESGDRELRMQRALFLSQFLRLLMVIDGVFLLLWAVIAWPFFLGLLLILGGWYGVKYYNTGLSCCVSTPHRYRAACRTAHQSDAGRMRLSL